LIIAIREEDCLANQDLEIADNATIFNLPRNSVGHSGI
jgi:hypothetical protein